MVTIQISNLAILASLMASLVAVPIASTSLSEEYDTAVATLTDQPTEIAEESMRTVEEVENTDGYKKKVETQEGTFKYVQEGQSEKLTLEKPGYTAKTVLEPDEAAQKITLPEKYFERVTSNSKSVSYCRSPEGEMEKKTEKGETSKKFTGTDQAPLKRDCEDAKSILVDSMEEITQLSLDTGLMNKDVEIVDLNYTTESVTFRNNLVIPLDLEGWSIEDSNGHSYEFEGGEIGPGEKVTVKSADLYEECEEHCWTSGYVWSQDGDTAKLFNGNGEEITRYSYEG